MSLYSGDIILIIGLFFTGLPGFPRWRERPVKCSSDSILENIQGANTPLGDVVRITDNYISRYASHRKNLKGPSNHVNNNRYYVPGIMGDIILIIMGDIILIIGLFFTGFPGFPRWRERPVKCSSDSILENIQGANTPLGDVVRITDNYISRYASHRKN